MFYIKLFLSLELIILGQILYAEFCLTAVVLCYFFNLGSRTACERYCTLTVLHFKVLVSFFLFSYFCSQWPCYVSHFPTNVKCQKHAACNLYLGCALRLRRTSTAVTIHHLGSYTSKPTKVNCAPLTPPSDCRSGYSHFQHLELYFV
jgi:hypothetical protein